jgi:glycosyltransferase involved in cell wall biosynthesis
MRVALLNPTYWPEVRRGSERMAHDLGVALVERGHDVTLLTSHRAPSAVSVEDGIQVVRRWRAPDGLPGTRAYEYYAQNIPNVISGLLAEDYDVAHALFPADAWAAAHAIRLGGPPFVFSFNGIPTRSYLVVRRYRLEMLSTAIRDAARVTVLSAAAAARFRRYLMHEPDVVPPGVRLEDFVVEDGRAPVPTLVCASSLGDPRKRAGLLLSAFARVRAELGDARLVLVRARDAAMSGGEPATAEGVEWIEADSTEALAGAYAAAWASVLPAPDEAFGLVLAESLAAGTPVVAARSGGCPEIVDDERVGRLFEPDDEADLARAMRQALELGKRAETADACRTSARRYAWAGLIERYEGMYEAAVGRPRALLDSRPLS